MPDFVALLCFAIALHSEKQAASHFSPRRAAPVMTLQEGPRTPLLRGDSAVLYGDPSVIEEGDFTYCRTTWQWMQFLWYSLLIKLLFVTIFVSEAVHDRETILSAGYFAFGVYFVYESKLLMRYRNQLFRYLVFFNYFVILSYLFFQVSFCHQP